MKLKSLVFFLFLLNACVSDRVMPGSLDSISGTYVSDEIWMENEGEKYRLKLVLMFNSTGEKGSFNARLENHTPDNQAVEDITGEIENVSGDPQSKLLIENMPLISLNTHKVFLLNAFGELSPESGSMRTLIEISLSDYLLKQTVDFTPVEE
ncbi:hypothetical protein [Jiulongibacter sediminis]|jgi:hypothetical protein|uniref:hypothetical protein n=1 Tax=Jiulongibacter sediminis TaxID=1605367 RepID=UPI0026EEF328|nr:hypothetical protein [Jiulongibacter sediminis]